MRRAALVATLFACGCASSAWERTERVPGGRLYVPKLYAPLLPGSIYPDKRAPVPAKRRPAIVVVCPAMRGCREREILEQAAQRGLVVLVTREMKNDLLRTSAEADPKRIGWLFVRPTEDFLRRWTSAGAVGKAIAVIAPASLPSYPLKNLLLAALLRDEPLEAGDATALKLYSPNKKGLLPNEAFRDAVEWLAGELGAR